MKNVLADGSGGWVADSRLCRSRVVAKFFSLVFLPKFCKIFNFVFCKIVLEFCKIQNNFIKILWFAKFWQCCFAATLCRSGVKGWGARPVLPWRTLRANADCPLFIFPLYCSPFCHLNSVDYTDTSAYSHCLWGHDNDYSDTIHKCWRLFTYLYKLKYLSIYQWPILYPIAKSLDTKIWTSQLNIRPQRVLSQKIRDENLVTLSLWQPSTLPTEWTMQGM